MLHLCWALPSTSLCLRRGTSAVPLTSLGRAPLAAPSANARPDRWMRGNPQTPSAEALGITRRTYASSTREDNPIPDRPMHALGTPGNATPPRRLPSNRPKPFLAHGRAGATACRSQIMELPTNAKNFLDPPPWLQARSTIVTVPLATAWSVLGPQGPGARWWPCRCCIATQMMPTQPPPALLIGAWAPPSEPPSGPQTCHFAPCCQCGTSTVRRPEVRETAWVMLAADPSASPSPPGRRAWHR